MVDRLMPLVANFKWLVQRIYYPSIERVGKITAPICFIRGLRDEIVPAAHSKQLFEKASSAKFKVMYEF